MLLLTLTFSYVWPLNIEPWPEVIIYACVVDDGCNNFFKSILFSTLFFQESHVLNPLGGTRVCPRSVCTLQYKTIVLVPPVVLPCLAM